MRYMTIKSAAEKLDCSVHAVRRMAAAGELPVTRLSERRLRIPEAALDRWLERRTLRTRGAP